MPAKGVRATLESPCAASFSPSPPAGCAAVAAPAALGASPADGHDCRARDRRGREQLPGPRDPALHARRHPLARAGQGRLSDALAGRGLERVAAGGAGGRGRAGSRIGRRHAACGVADRQPVVGRTVGSDRGAHDRTGRAGARPSRLEHGDSGAVPHSGRDRRRRRSCRGCPGAPTSRSAEQLRPSPTRSGSRSSITRRVGTTTRAARRPRS